MPDAESVQALERRGDLHFTHPHWMEKDGQAQEATGTGGQGRSGRALARFALQRIRASLTAVMLDFRDYTRQENVLSESGREPEGQELPVVFTWDTPGGVAPGAIEVIKREVEDMARNLGVKVRFLIIGLALGSILPSNPVQGALNEEAAFRYLQADLAINIDY